MSTRILFVCLGNICRSPAAEGVTRQLADGRGFTLDSAGMSSWHIDEPPYGPMIEAAARRGYDLSAQRARQFTRRDFQDFELILAMDEENLAAIEYQRPPGDQTVVRLFTDYAPETGAHHVPDPYYTRDFEETLDLVEACAQGLLRSL